MGDSVSEELMDVGDRTTTLRARVLRQQDTR